MEMIIGSPNKLYSVVLADPPWAYRDQSANRGGAEKHYRTMAFEDIQALPVKRTLAKDALLFLWCTWPHMNLAKPLMESWGFTFRTCAFVWVKQTSKSNKLFWGMGHWTRSNTEFCLLGVKGKPKRASAGVHQVVQAPIEAHSKKPDVFYERINDLVGDSGNRLELFARRLVLGWDAWGNEV